MIFYNFQLLIVMIDHYRNDDLERLEKEEIYSNAIRAGKRTYFFDVKATKGNDYFLTITESKKRTDNEGNSHFEKHKIFLYKEDFEKFNEGFKDVLRVINQLQRGENLEFDKKSELNSTDKQSNFSSVNFDEL